MKTPVRESTRKVQVEKDKNPVRIPCLHDKTARDSPTMYEKIPNKSPRVRLMQPRTFRAKTPQKGDSNGESIDESDVDLKLTKRRHNLDIGTDTGEGQEILDPEIKIPEESDFYEPEPLEQVIDVKKQWYKFLPKQGDVNKILTQINHKILRDTKLPLMLKDLKAAYLTSPHFKDVYLHLLQNRAPINKSAASQIRS